MKKKISYTFLFILVLFLSISLYYTRKLNQSFFKERSSYLEYTFEPKPIHFNWVSTSKGSEGHHESQAAIIFPVTIDSFAHQFHMQFDTGAPHSFIYENDLKSLIAIGMDIKEIRKGDERFIKQLNFKLNDNLIRASMIRILEDYGHTFDENDTIAKIGIGTIGSDFIKERISVIDFKKQTLELFYQRPNWMKILHNFKPFDFTSRRIMLPVVIDNKDYELFYDSGCSAFGLITTKNRFDRYTDQTLHRLRIMQKVGIAVFQLPSKLSNQLMTIGNVELNLKRVSFIDMYTPIQPFVTPFTRIGGWLGNQPFNESTLILDTKKEEFIVIDSKQ